MVAQLRNANIRAELYLGNPKNTWATSSNMPTAATRPASIVQGSDEKARGEIQIKDLIDGAKAAAAIASNQEWRRDSARRNSRAPKTRSSQTCAKCWRAMT